MRLLKGFIIALAGLFIVITLFSLLMPSRVMTVRVAVIHASPGEVFTQIADLQNWKRWHPVFMQDSNGIAVSKPSTGVNAFATWNSNGKQNKLLIIDLFDNGLKASLIRAGENEVQNILSVTPVNNSNNVQVEWRVLTKLKWYPWEKFSGIFIDKMTGPGYETALNNLRDLVEKQQGANPGN